MPTPTIIKGEEYFNTVIYEGNGGAQRVGRFVPFTDQATVANSCIFNGATNNYLSRTASSNGSGTTLTFSCWVKRGLLGERDIMFTNDFSANGEVLQFDSSNRLYYYKVQSGWSYISNRTFEDTSKFYHILIARDTTNSTAGDRIKIYVDGDRITSWSTETQPSLNATGFWNQTTYSHTVGNSGNASYIRGIGYLAEVNMIDGQALLPASFGITDTSTGRWIPKTVEPFPTTTTSIAVTVVDSGGNKFALDSVTQGTVTLIEGATYKFDQSDSSNSGHPLRFSLTSNGTHGGGSEFTSGVTTVGTSGSSGAYTQITVPTGTATLYYYCSNHSGMGGTANTQDAYGTNGLRLTFSDSSNLGADSSGNSNSLTATNLASTDQTTDSPTQNHMVFDANRNGGQTLSEGNLKLTMNASHKHVMGTMLLPKSGKFYWETTITTNVAQYRSIGIAPETHSLTDTSGNTDVRIIQVVLNDATRDGRPISWNNGHQDLGSSIGTMSNGTVVSWALDADNEKLYISIGDNNWKGFDTNASNPATGSNPVFKNVFKTTNWRPIATSYSNSTSHVFDWNFGQRTFANTVPSAFVALQQDNLPETDKNISSFVWVKNRDNGNRGHQLYDSSRGALLTLYSNGNNAESTNTDSLQKFLKGGFSAEDFTGLNEASESHVAWNWVANNGTTASNTDGSITTTTQANTTAGFSIVEFTTPSGGPTITLGHGLTQSPEWFFFKRKDGTGSWLVFHKSAYDASNGGHSMVLNSSSANSAFNPEYGSTAIYPQAPTATTFALRNPSATAPNANYIAYCWHGVDGFSKFGSYTGNGNSNGAFIYTGFKPSWIMFKCISSSTGWNIRDTSRSSLNPLAGDIQAQSSNAEVTSGSNIMDFLSNGFKCRGSGGAVNGSGQTYIYMAFAEHPFIGDGVSPATAR